MKYLALDLGSYSLKSTLVKLDRRQLFLLDAQEFVLEDLKQEIDPEGDTLSLHRTLIENIIPEDFEGKVIYQVPNQMITSRHLNLPVTQRKKVEMMIPFQLDENLPFPAISAHYFNQLHKKGTTTSALVNVAKRQELQDYFNYYDEKETLPNVLTTELSVVHAFAHGKNIHGPTAILDIGHRTSKCYLLYEGEVVSHHFSFCAGATIDEVIAETYQIPLKEAVIYKHQNCFFLTEGQYDGVTEDQKEFAILMKQTMMPLALEVKRWLLGFRVKYGMPIEKLYITGGSSNIHNIANFIAQQVGVKTDYFSTGESLIDEGDKLTANECSYFLSALMNITLTGKSKPGNFLHGDFSTGANVTLPIHSIGFYLQRGAFLFIILGILFGLETFLLSQREKKLDRQILTLIKQPDYGFSVTEKRRWRNRLTSIKKKVERKNKNIEQEVSTLMSSTKVDALNPLLRLFESLGADENLELVEFSTNGQTSEGVFNTKKTQTMSTLQETLRAAALPNLDTKVKGSRLHFSFGEKQ